jgi:copper(I)-binding protein
MKQSEAFGSLKVVMKAKFLPVTALVLGMFLAVGVSSEASADEPAAVRDAWVRAPAPGQSIAGAYMELTASAKSALVSVTSPVAARGEMHSTSMEGGIMRMRPADRIELPRGKTVKLEPGGLHVMLIDLKRTLKSGEKVPLVLTVQRADGSRATLTVQAEVRAAGGMAMHHH